VPGCHQRRGGYSPARRRRTSRARRYQGAARGQVQRACQGRVQQPFVSQSCRTAMLSQTVGVQQQQRSRTDDRLRGGDIDLLLEMPQSPASATLPARSRERGSNAPMACARSTSWWPTRTHPTARCSPLPVVRPWTWVGKSEGDSRRPPGRRFGRLHVTQAMRTLLLGAGEDRPANPPHVAMVSMTLAGGRTPGAQPWLLRQPYPVHAQTGGFRHFCALNSPERRPKPAGCKPLTVSPFLSNPPPILPRAHQPRHSGA